MKLIFLMCGQFSSIKRDEFLLQKLWGKFSPMKIDEFFTEESMRKIVITEDR